MSWGVFTNRNRKPDMDEAFEMLGVCRPIFERLTGFIEERFQIRGEFKFYGRNYGWALRYNKSGKALIALYPGEGGFTAQIILDRVQTVEALNSEMPPPVKDIISNTPEIHEGRWIFIRVGNEKEVGDIEKLMMIRAMKRGDNRGNKD